MAKTKSSKKSASSEKSSKESSAEVAPATGLAAALRLPTGEFQLTELSTTPLAGGPKDKQAAEKALAEFGPSLAEMQEKLHAESTAGGRRSVLLLLQGMDTAGKDGVISHVVGLLNPGAVHIASFKQPTPDELAHDFLWRIENQVPEAGDIGVFNRSQYEDVLIVRVHELVPKAVWAKRFAQINAFERQLARDGVTVIKCFLHISKETQAERLMARLEDPTKYWKYNTGDVDERERWDAYQEVYTDALRKCSTVGNPWYVIPSDKKWYRNWAVGALLHEKLTALNLQYPPADFDVATEKKRVAES
ncbi:MAG: polyphosphate kinase 2 family protein [Actinomycetota bacterium]|nr:polyphosphate kinase 2 family protein [Actinomycetota bacterium]